MLVIQCSQCVSVYLCIHDPVPQSKFGIPRISIHNLPTLGRTLAEKLSHHTEVVINSVS